MNNKTSSHWYFAGAGLFALVSGALHLGYRSASNLQDIADESLVLLHARLTTKDPVTCEFTQGLNGSPTKSLYREVKLCRLWKDRKSSEEPWVHHESVTKHIFETAPNLRLKDDTGKVSVDADVLKVIPRTLSYSKDFFPRSAEKSNKLKRNEKEVAVTAQEWIVANGTQLTCVGTIKKEGGRLLLTRKEGKPYIISTGTPAQLVDDFELRKNLWFWGTITTAVIGAGLAGAGAYNKSRD